MTKRNVEQVKLEFSLLVMLSGIGWAG